MANYFRITAYSPAENIGMIVDSNGKFEKVWQFSSCPMTPFFFFDFSFDK